LRRLLYLLLTAIGEWLGAIIPVVVICDTGGGIDNVGTAGGCGIIAGAAGAAGATDFFLNVFFKKLVNFLKRPTLGGNRVVVIGLLARRRGGEGRLLGCNSSSNARSCCL
jgi:hypothetical protein